MTRKILSITLPFILSGLVVCLSSCTIPASEEFLMLKSKEEQVSNNKQIMHKFIELFESGNWDDFDQVIATDCILHYPGGVDVIGLDAMKAGWQVYFGSMQDMAVTPLAEISEGDILMEFYTFAADYTGEYMGQQVEGVPITYNQVEMVRIEDNRIVEWWVEMDRLWMAQQLGMDLQW